MNTRALLFLAVAIAAALFLVLGGHESPSPGAVDDAPRDTEDAAPQLETAGAPRQAEPAPKPLTAPLPPRQAPERPVEVNDLRVRLSGRVLDPDARPMPNVPVRVYSYFDSTATRIPMHAETIADADGRFVLEFTPRYTVTTHDPWMRLRIAAFHPTYVMAIANAYANTREVKDNRYVRDGIDLKMQHPFAVVCRVRDEEGRPIAGATCGLEQFYGRKYWIDGRHVQAKTDEQGVARLVLPRISDDVIMLRLHGHNAWRVSAPGFATVYQRVHVPSRVTPGFVSETDVVLTTPYEIRGRVVDQDGNALVDSELSVTGRRKDEWGVLVFSKWAQHGLRTDEEGRFVLSAVEAGTWKLEFQMPGYRDARVTASADSDIVVTLTRELKMTMLFRDARRAQFLGVARHEVEYSDGGGYVTSGGVAEKRLELKEMPPGKHKLTVYFAGRAQPFETEFVARVTEEPVVHDVPAPTEGVTLTGRVTAGDGKPIHTAWVTLSDSRDDAQVEDLDWRTAGDGSFRFEGVAPGTYKLELDRDMYAPRIVEVVVGKEDLDRTVQLVRGATLRVVFPPIPDKATWRYDVRVLHASGVEVDGRFMGEDAKNEVVFLHRPPGETRVTLETSQFRTRRFEGDSYTRRITLENGREAVVSFEDAQPVTIRGRVRVRDGPWGRPGGLQLRRIGPAFPLSDVRTNHFFGSKKAAVDEKGGFALDGLLPGRYAVANLKSGGKPPVFEVGSDPIDDLVLDCDG